MNTQPFALLTILMTLVSPAVAGPFRTQVVKGADVNPDYTPRRSRRSSRYNCKLPLLESDWHRKRDCFYFGLY
jgi:hypothetical protein